MACSVTLSGLVRDCDPNAGGIKALYIANADDVTAVGLDQDGALITSITMATGVLFKGFYFKRGQASFTLAPQFTDAGEYAGEQATISVAFGRMDTTKRTQLAALSVSELRVIAIDNNDKAWYFGYNFPVLRTGGEAQSGAAATDRNQYAIELQANDNQYPYELNSTALASAIGA